MRSVLVTGATGFVGRALCDRMLAEGWRVQGAVRDPHDVSRLPAHVDPAVIGAIGPETAWAGTLQGVDTIVHLAARVHMMKDSAVDPLADFRRVNAEGTGHLARMAADAGVRRFVFASSVKVNGEGMAEAYTEMDAPAPAEPYAMSKSEAETVLHRIAEQTGLEMVILRLPLVYGPGVHANFRMLMDVVQRGIPLPLAQLDNRRSFIYLGNLIDAISLCCLHPAAGGKTYLVSDGVDVSTPELIRSIASALGKPARLFPFPPLLLRLLGRMSGKSPAVERLLGSLTVDSSRIRQELGWAPPFTMEQGLRETASWYAGHCASRYRGNV